MQRLLRHDEDADFLLDGIARGFKLVADISVVVAADCRNYRSAIDSVTKPLLDKLFLEELSNGRFSEVPTKPLRVNSIVRFQNPVQTFLALSLIVVSRDSTLLIPISGRIHSGLTRLMTPYF